MLLLQVQSSLSKSTDFRDLRYGDIENIYQSLKFDLWPIYGVAIILALIFSIFNIFNQAQKDMSGSKDIDIGAFINLIKAKWKFMIIIMAMPFIFSALEGLFGVISDQYIAQFQEPNASIYDSLKKQIDLLAQKEVSNNIFDYNVAELVLDAVDYTIVLSLQPALVFYIESTYSSALVFRFFFLFCVELISGIAFACLLNERTISFFYNWVKALLISFLLIPAFLFANVFTNAIYEYMLMTDNYNWIFPLLLLIAGIKTVLFMSVPIIFYRIF